MYETLYIADYLKSAKTTIYIKRIEPHAVWAVLRVVRQMRSSDTHDPFRHFRNVT